MRTELCCKIDLCDHCCRHDICYYLSHLLLTKAVLDEQAKNVELEDFLRERDQTIRKSEAEMDSLTFRNQQLARRIEVLQEEDGKR